jgi:predicted methyltransferase
LKVFALTLMALLVVGCGQKESTSTPASASASADTAPASAVAAPVEAAAASLDEILAAQSDEMKARYPFRHPKETLEFFGIVPGMTVVEVLPGGGWYSQILVPYLGQEGKLIGLDYDFSMWDNFDWVNEGFLESRKQWPAKFKEDGQVWGGANGAEVVAYDMSSLPEELHGTADAVLFIRALHNLYRFEQNGEHLTLALTKAHQLLKPGGVVGVVQHALSEESPDEWATGEKGYLKQSQLIARMEAAGFEFVAESAINANPKDVPGTDDNVWRLPPSYSTSRNDEQLKQQYAAIGESNRMTLLFRKPQ